MEYCIVGATEKDGMYRVNDANLVSVADDGTETYLANGLYRTTAKGWESKKDCLVALDIVEKDGRVLVISEKCALSLLSMYGERAKVYTDPMSFGASRDLAIASWINEDPYNRDFDTIRD